MLSQWINIFLIPWLSIGHPYPSPSWGWAASIKEPELPDLFLTPSQRNCFIFFTAFILFNRPGSEDVHQPPLLGNRHGSPRKRPNRLQLQTCRWEREWVRQCWLFKQKWTHVFTIRWSLGCVNSIPWQTWVHNAHLRSFVIKCYIMTWNIILYYHIMTITKTWCTFSFQMKNTSRRQSVGSKSILLLGGVLQAVA